MACHQRKPSIPKDQGKLPRGILKRRPQPTLRRSARLQHLQKQIVSKDTDTERKHPLLSLPSNASGKEACPLQAQDRKPKRAHEPKEPHIRAPTNHLRKQQQTHIANSVLLDTGGQSATGDITHKIDPVEYWIRKGTWPKEYFDQNNQNLSLQPS
ncbi:MAG: hypothetical protein M1834_009559 [Cirrosporium novae-zelandiae]|nr:MAG: hypothetical protein M1834_009559 [Cirrosporium novae-zelandiae]